MACVEAGFSIASVPMKAASLWLSVWFFMGFWSTFSAAADPLPQALIKTGEGNILIELDLRAAPLSVAQFQRFIEDRIYVGSAFHEAPDGNEIQGGKPGVESSGEAKNGRLPNEKSARGEFHLRHTRGAVVFARTIGACNPEKTNNGTQFCIYLEDKPQNEGEFTVFGRVVQGLDVAARIASRLKEKAHQSTTILSVDLVE